MTNTSPPRDETDDAEGIMTNEDLLAALENSAVWLENQCKVKVRDHAGRRVVESDLNAARTVFSAILAEHFTPDNWHLHPL